MSAIFLERQDLEYSEERANGQNVPVLRARKQANFKKASAHRDFFRYLLSKCRAGCYQEPKGLKNISLSIFY